ncbi:cytochrome ubiquinol oxidase subunit II [bacterium]|nr:cytochrome ubiquinol oxidase subunit II [bacterium]
MNRFVMLFTLAASWLLAGALEASTRSDSFMDPLGPIAEDQKTHLIWVTGLTLIAVLPVFILLPLILFKFNRKSGKGDYRPKWEKSHKLEFLMWGIPIILVAFMSYRLWNSTHDLDPYKEIESANPTVRVQVVGLDWKWLFIYPDYGIATVGEFAIPVDHPAELTLTTDTVMQSFIIPALGGQIYAMPAMTTQLNLLATQPGIMEGENTQYNGDGFVEQKFMTLAQPIAEFESWVEKVRQNSVPLDEETYRILARRSSRSEVQAALGTAQMPEKALYFTLPDTELFTEIVMRYSNGKDLTPETQPGAAEFNNTAPETDEGGDR